MPFSLPGAVGLARLRSKNRLWVKGSERTFPGTSEARGRAFDFERACRFDSIDELDGFAKLWGRRDRFGLGAVFRASQIGVKGDGYKPVEADSQPFTAGTGLSIEGV